MKERNRFCVYIHSRKSDGKVFYVGKGLAKRSRNTITRSAYWKRIVAKHGLVVSILKHSMPEQEAFELESFLISEIGRENLCNMTDGGEGLAGHIFTESHRAKIAAGLRTGAWLSCLHCGTAFWRKKNEITKGLAKYCSKKCYQVAQVGAPKVGRGSPLAAIEAAAKARKSQVDCKRGHPLSGENLFLTSLGGRGCKECRKIHKAAYLERLK